MSLLGKTPAWTIPLLSMPFVYTGGVTDTEVRAPYSLAVQGIFPLRCYLRACSLPRQWLFLTEISLPFPLPCSSSPTSRLAPDSVLICSWEEAENTRSRPHPGHCPRPFLSSHHTVRGSSCPLFFRGLGGTCSGPILGGGGSHHQLETAGQGHKKFMVKAIGLCGLCSVPYVPSVTLKFLDFSMA